MDDIRYSELVFLRNLANKKWSSYAFEDRAQAAAVGVPPELLADMIETLLEDLYIRLQNNNDQQLVGLLRREVVDVGRPPRGVQTHDWKNPREELRSLLMHGRSLHSIEITYRGLRRIEELRDVLRYDRVLEDFGILLSIRYVNADLEHALQRSADVAVSVIYADMDDFGPINKQFGQEAGDEVMKRYLEAVRDGVGVLGTAYRGVGDEVVIIIAGQDHDAAVQVADSIRLRVCAIRAENRGQQLPPVTASLGVASSPPEKRSRDLPNVAEERKRRAKEGGKNRVVAG